MWLMTNENSPFSAELAKKELHRYLASSHEEDQWLGFMIWSLYAKCSYSILNKISKSYISLVKSVAKNLLNTYTDSKESGPEIDFLSSYAKGIPDKTLSRSEADKLVAENISAPFKSKRQGVTPGELGTAIREGKRGEFLVYLYNPKTFSHIKYIFTLPGHGIDIHVWDKSMNLPERVAYEASVYNEVAVETFSAKQTAKKRSTVSFEYWEDLYLVVKDHLADGFILI